MTLLATGAMHHAADYRDVVVAYRNGAPIKLNEVARVIDSVENDKVATWFNDSRAIVLAIQRQPDANTVEVVDMVRAKLPQMRAQVPPAIQMQPLFDRSISIRAAVLDVQETLVIAICLVIMVIFLFLRKVSATIIPALAVPVSLIGTCAAMYAFGFSINNMTLLALTLSVGFVVDDAIVMLENIVRHIEGGMRPFEAALKGSREIGFTIISITFSLIAVFIPVLLMGGMVGRVFREFAVSIAVAIIVSGFVSLTLTPMLCARVLKSHRPARETELRAARLRAHVCGIGSRPMNGRSTGCSGQVDHVDGDAGDDCRHDLALRHRAEGFLPDRRHRLYGRHHRSAIPTSRFRRWSSTSARSPTSCAPTRRSLMSIRRSAPAAPTRSATAAACWSRSSRATSATACRKSSRGLRKNANVVAGIQIFFQPIQNINLGGRLNKSQYQYTLQSNDTEALYRITPELRDKIAQDSGPARRHHRSLRQEPAGDRRGRSRKVGGLRRVGRSGAPGALQRLRLAPGRDHLHAGERLPGHPGDHARIPADPNDLNRIFLKTTNGTTVPLSAVTHFVRTVGPLQVNHQGQQPAVTISFNLAPDFSLGQAVDAITEIERDERLPATITTGFQGTAQVFQDSLRGQGILILAAIFAAYVVLGILYESFIHPITIISGLPSAGIGAILTLMLFRMDLSVIAMIGIVMLVGIVKKNAIMMIDFAIERRRVGLSAEAAIREAAMLRFRPDHDDDLRGDLRHAADRARHRRGRRIAPAARRRGGRRSGAVAAADALHHAGDLSLPRPLRPDDQAPARATAGGSRESAAGGRGGIRFRRRRDIFLSLAGRSPGMPVFTAGAVWP